ncbi:hypothetical protein PSMK_14470 [Phycisphaera mikurensis NBRC 102666]|uniref:Uncharacterized protein n=1 Tax=Phycisphaera mikurensis (strain NBRC 102666 / KCTC 22515 / FYK2301M01) TaxID=1142394 RepID=I0IEB8_PHYMF|nr:hypothetical protein PSMK_14470 [Phycisphaera mikurensis NBRC 102666]
MGERRSGGAKKRRSVEAKKRGSEEVGKSRRGPGRSRQRPRPV